MMELEWLAGLAMGLALLARHLMMLIVNTPIGLGA